MKKAGWLKPVLWKTIKVPRVLAFEHRHVKNQHQEVAAFFVTEYHKMRVVSLIRKLENGWIFSELFAGRVNIIPANNVFMINFHQGYLYLFFKPILLLGVFPKNTPILLLILFCFNLLRTYALFGAEREACAERGSCLHTWVVYCA